MKMISSNVYPKFQSPEKVPLFFIFWIKTLNSDNQIYHSDNQIYHSDNCLVVLVNKSEHWTNHPMLFLSHLCYNNLE